MSHWMSANHVKRPTVTKEDIQNHFKDSAGTITEIKLMNGFGFIEYEDAIDARDVVPGKWPKIVILSVFQSNY